MKTTANENEIAALKAHREVLCQELDSLAQDLEHRGNVQQSFTRLERQQIHALPSLDPMDSDALAKFSVEEIRLASLRRWLQSRRTRLFTGCERLTAQLLSAKPLIQAVAEARSSEEGLIWQCGYSSLIATGTLSDPDIDLFERAHRLRGIAGEVLNDIDRLLSQRVPRIPTQDELSRLAVWH